MVDIGLTESEISDIEHLNLQIRSLKHEAFDRVIQQLWKESNIEYVRWSQYEIYDCPIMPGNINDEEGVGKVFYSDEVQIWPWNATPCAWVDTDVQCIMDFFGFLRELGAEEFLKPRFGENVIVKISRDAEPLITER